MTNVPSLDTEGFPECRRQSGSALNASVSTASRITSILPASTSWSRSTAATASEIANDALERPVAERGHQPQFGIVDAPRDNRRHVSETRSQTAQDVRAATAVAVDEIRLRLVDVLGQPVGERQVQIAGAEQIAHGNRVRPGGSVDTGAGRDRPAYPRVRALRARIPGREPAAVRRRDGARFRHAVFSPFE